MSDEKVNLNLADVSELAGLPGIGQKLATKIVAYRERQQPFSDVADLSDVPGISKHKVKKLEDRLTVGEREDIEESAVVKTEADVLDKGALPISGEESSSIVHAATNGEATLMADVEPVTSHEIYSELDSDEQEETFSPAEGDVLPEDQVADLAGTEPEVPELEEAPDVLEALEAEPGEEPESESVFISEQDVIDTDLEEDSVAAVPTPAQADTQPMIIAGYILSTIAGAFIGALLVLIFLLLANRTLRFAGDASTGDYLDQLDQDINALRQGQENLKADIDAFSRKLEELDSQLAEVTDSQEASKDLFDNLWDTVASFEDEMLAVNGTLTDWIDTVVILEEEFGAFDERLAAMAQSSEDFDTFLNGMFDLLNTLQESPTTSNATATIPAAGSPVPNTPTPTVTAVPTRTPRPTATPLAIPSPTLNP